MIHFSFLRIPTRICPSFWVFMLFFSNFFQNPSFKSIILCGVLFLSLLVHEYGHAFTASYFGTNPTITLRAFGGEAQYDAWGITPKQEFLITLNGPLFQSVLIVLSYLLIQSDLFVSYPVRYFLYAMMRFNILWVLLNLIPVVPLDGGHLLRYFLERKLGELKGKKISSIVALISIALVMPYLLVQGFFFFAILLSVFAFQHCQILRNILPSGKSPFRRYQEGVEAMQEKDFSKAKSILVKLLKSKDSYIKNLAIESVAKIYAQESEDQKAYQLLMKADQQALRSGKCLLCKLAFKQKNYELVVRYAYEIYQYDPSYEIALLNSQSFAALNQHQEAEAWLHTARQFECFLSS